MKNFLLSLICFLYGSNVFCQVPGYMGKRFSAGYDMQISLPGLTNFLALMETRFFVAEGINYNGHVNSIWIPQLKHSVVAEYVISRRVALSAGYQSYRFGLSSYVNPYSEQMDSFYRVRTNGFRFGFSVAANNYIAPQGKYFSMDVQLLNQTFLNFLNQQETEIASGSLVGINMDWGIRRILFDRVLLDYAFGIGMTLNNKYTVNMPWYEDQLDNARWYHLAFNLAHFKVGARYLLF